MVRQWARLQASSWCPNTPAFSTHRAVVTRTRKIMATVLWGAKDDLVDLLEPGSTINAESVERHSSVTRAARVVTIQAAPVCCNMPSSEDLVHLLLLSENSMLKRRVVRGCKRGIKRWGVHPINRRRRAHGEYHHLMKQLKEKPERFFPVHSDELSLSFFKATMSFFLSFAGGSRGSCSSAILNRLKTGLAVPSTLSGAAHCRSPLKSIVTPLFTFARQHMGPDCKALAERCRSDARRSTLDAHRSYRARGLIVQICTKRLPPLSSDVDLAEERNAAFD
ncbi:hypothetical protein J6590_106400, partial [Homalodisca vitripennis]